MNLRDLKYLVTVAELKHFGRAAEVCCVSQPTLSAQLKKLEEELGVTIFERSNKQVLVTELGQHLVAEAKRVLHAAEQMKTIADSFANPLAGRFHLAFIPTVGPYLLPHIVSELAKQLPDTEFYFYEEKTEVCCQKLQNGSLDAAIMATPVPINGLQHTPLFTESLYAAVPNNHALRGSHSIEFADLAEEPFLLLEEGHCLRDQTLEICNLARDQERQGYRATSLETLRAMVSAGMGVTLIPQIATLNTVSNEGIELLPFANPAPEREIAMYWRTISAKQTLCQAVYSIIQNTLQPLLNAKG